MSAKRLHFGLFTGLLQILRRNWPESLVGKGLGTNSISKMVAGLFKVHNMVKFLQANPSAGFNIWVDNWPSPSAVLCKADQDKCMIYGRYTTGGRALRTAGSISERILATKLNVKFLIYSLVRRLQRGVFKDFIVWVDKWPEPEAVVANADLDICKINCWKVFVLAFDKNPASFLSLLLEVDNPALQNKLIRVISVISQETTKLLQKAFPNRSYEIDELELMLLRQGHNAVLGKSLLPAGFHAGTMTHVLSEDVVEQATEWKGYLEPIAIYNAATIYDCPYSAVYDKDDNPVGWFMQHRVLGSLNHLFVLPEFRRKGIGKFLIEEISKAALHKDGYAFIQVRKENPLSIKMHSDSGFEIGCHLTYYILLED